MDMVTSDTKSPHKMCMDAMQGGIDLLLVHCEFRDWREKILKSSEPVDVSSGANCVLARIYGTSLAGFTALGGNSRDFLVKHGFSPSAMFPGGWRDHTVILNATWNRRLGLTNIMKTSQVEAPVTCK